jgi:hypothetical protein
VGISVPARQIVVDHAKLQRMLGSPELAWLVDRIRGRLEQGEPIDGTVTLVGAMPTQRRAAARLLGRNVGRGTSLSVALPAVAAELWRAAAAPDPVSAAEALGGPVRSLAAERPSRPAGRARCRHRASVTGQRAPIRQAGLGQLSVSAGC